MFWEIPQIRLGEDTVSIRTATRPVRDREIIAETIGTEEAGEGEKISIGAVPLGINIYVMTKTSWTSREVGITESELVEYGIVRAYLYNEEARYLDLAQQLRQILEQGKG